MSANSAIKTLKFVLIFIVIDRLNGALKRSNQSVVKILKSQDEHKESRLKSLAVALVCNLDQLEGCPYKYVSLKIQCCSFDVGPDEIKIANIYTILLVRWWFRQIEDHTEAMLLGR